MKHGYFKVSNLIISDMFWTSTLVWYLPIRIGHNEAVSTFKKLHRSRVGTVSSEQP